jgi:hypothetical protein
MYKISQEKKAGSQLFKATTGAGAGSWIPSQLSEPEPTPEPEPKRYKDWAKTNSFGSATLVVGVGLV